MLHNVERKGMETLLHKIQASDDRRKDYVKILDIVKTFFGKQLTDDTYHSALNFINSDNKYLDIIDEMMDTLHPNVLKQTVLNLGYEGMLKGTQTIRKNREKYGCNIPWLILFDPTTACNMHCAGCWSGTYGNKYNLSYEDMDKIITEGKKLGVYVYFLTGGEPLVRKKDLIRLARVHNDVQFGVFTNSTLIDEQFCKDVVEVGNIIFLLSIEGTPETNDGRRGDGHYNAVMHAMGLFKQYGILFGTSICYTRENIDAVTSDAFFELLEEKGARFGFYFHYMPVGNNAVTELLPTAAQRKYMIERIREIRSNDNPIHFYPMDFQNDGEYVGGCIAGGRNYFHINARGDCEPCVFIHYSDANIHDKSLLDILRSPLFMAYHEGQPFNKNHLRPCPMLENPHLLRQMVKETGARDTNFESPESVDHLCDKCEDYASVWGSSIEEYWQTHHHPDYIYKNYKKS